MSEIPSETHSVIGFRLNSLRPFCAHGDGHVWGGWGRLYDVDPSHSDSLFSFNAQGELEREGE